MIMMLRWRTLCVRSATLTTTPDLPRRWPRPRSGFHYDDYDDFLLVLLMVMMFLKCFSKMIWKKCSGNENLGRNPCR